MLLPQDFNKIDRNGLFIDVRSPSEFKEATIPGSINIPIFDDEERKIIGTLYKNSGQYEATVKGLEFAAIKFEKIFKEIYELKNTHKNIILFCARGGMRSGVVSSLINSLGTNVTKIKGGYKAYRKAITEELKTLNENVEYVVVHGNTGVGKTEILNRLQEEGYPVLDLEGTANHRGSLLGGVGLDEPNSQKMFESLIHKQMEDSKDKKYILVEAESRRIGKVFVPDFIHKKMKDGKHIFLDADIDFRCDVILREYTKGENYQEEMIECVEKMEKYLGKNKATELTEMLKRDEIYDFTKILMETYYDPMYMNTSNKYDYDLSLNIKSIKDAVDSIEKWADNQYNIIDE